MNRKKTISAVMLAILLAAGFLFRQLWPQNTVKQITAEDFVMDTVVTQTIYTTGDDPSGEITALLSELENTYLSWTNERSETAEINASAGRPAEISEELKTILQKMLDISEKSGGALDPAMGEVIRLWDIGGDDQKIPAQEELETLLQKADYKKIILAEDSVMIPEGTTLDLGAVGKGAGCDRIAAYLAGRPEIKGCLINLGSSSVLTYGEKPDGSPWKIAVRDPENPDPDAYLGIVELNGTQFLSTSGNYEKFFEVDGVRYHHILDPKTGFPADSGLSSVTVVASDGLTADGLSTACFILGPEEGLKLLREYGAAGVLVTADGKVVTEGDITFSARK